MTPRRSGSDDRVPAQTPATGSLFPPGPGPSSGVGWALLAGLAAVELLVLLAITFVPWMLVASSLHDPQAGYLVGDLRRYLYWEMGFAAAPWLVAVGLARARIRLVLLGMVATAPAWVALVALSGR